MFHKLKRDVRRAQESLQRRLHHKRENTANSPLSSIDIPKPSNSEPDPTHLSHIATESSTSSIKPKAGAANDEIVVSNPSFSPNKDSGIFNSKPAGTIPRPAVTGDALEAWPETYPREEPDVNSGFKHSAWAGLKKLVNVIDAGAEVFGPLRSAIHGLADCIEIFERESQTRRDYEDLKLSLNALCGDISRFLSIDPPPPMTPTIMSIALSIEKEARIVQQVQDKTLFTRVAGALEDLDLVVQFYNRMQGHLGRLTLNINMDTWNMVNEQVIDSRMRSLDPSFAASYNSAESENLRRNGCCPNTRIQVLNSLQSWARDEVSQRIYWLNGMAGTGKTTIAYSLCQDLHDSGKLAASFFCSRQLPNCREVNRILPSIAYQLASFSRPLRYAISRALERNPDVDKQRLSRQFECLVADPLRLTKGSLPKDLVIVIDALDECEDRGGVRRILLALLANALDLPIKLCVTSRPEPDILAGMEDEQGNCVKLELRLHELEQSTVQEDIMTFLTEKLAHVHVGHDIIARLASQSGVLFIYASTLVRYIDCGNPAWRARRLNQVLEGPGSSESKRTRDIDELYTTILHEALDNKDIESWENDLIRQVLHAVMFAQEPISVETIAGLLKLDDDTVRAALAPLLSILHLSAHSKTVTALHESFRDYITDEKRSSIYCCDAAQEHTLYAQVCYDLTRKLDPAFNIFNLESSYLLDCEVSDLPGRIERSISSHLFYACKYWEAHMERSVKNKMLLDETLEFLSTRLLVWMEVMNLKQQTYVAARLLHRLKSWVQENNFSGLAALAQDAWRFITEFASSEASKSTPHLYISALPLWPNHRPVSINYAKRMVNPIQITGSGMRQRERAPIAICKGPARVNCVAFSPKDAHLVSGFTSGTICVWDVHTGEMLGYPIQGHSDWVNSVVYSPHGDRIASGSSDHSIRLWDSTGRKMVGQPLEGHTDWVDCVAFSPDGKSVASGSSDQTIRIWNAETGKSIGKPLSAHTEVVKSISYSPDGARIASGSGDHTIRIWDIATGELVGNVLRGHTGWVYSVSYSPCGTHVVSGSDDGDIRIWNADTGVMEGGPLKGHTDWVRSVTYSPSGEHIISASSDRTIRCWDAKTREPQGIPLQGHADVVTTVACSSDELHIASGSDDGVICIWDAQLTKNAEGIALASHTDRVKSVMYSPNGRYAVSGSSDDLVYIWDVHTGQIYGNPLRGHTGWVNSVAFSPQGNDVAAGSDDGTICIWDVGSYTRIGQPFAGHTGRVFSIAYSPDGLYIISASEDCTIRKWDVRTGEMFGQPLTGHTDWVRSVSYSPDGSQFASGSDDGTIRIWDAHNSQILGQPLQGHESGVTSVAYSPDNKYLVSGSSDHTIRVWDRYSGQIHGRPFCGHTDRVHSVAYSPSGAYIVSGSEDSTIRIWNAHTGDPLGQPLLGHAGRVTSVAYSPDGLSIISGSHDRTIRIWDADPSLGADDAASHETDWRLEKTGWVVRPTGTRLIWLPSDVRPGLLYPRNKVVISTSGTLKLDFTQAKLGEQWEQCYVP